MFPLSNWRVYLLAAVLCLGGWGGWKLNGWMNPPAAAPAPVTNTVVVERVITKTVTVTKSPDGTVTETTTESTADTSSSTSKPTPVAKPKWSAEALVYRPWSEERDWAAIGYRRIGDTNAWVGAGWSNPEKAVMAAIRVDF